MDVRYPIGKFSYNETIVTEPQRKIFIREIAELPEKLEKAIKGLGDQQLDSQYREGGWTLRQVVHHMADSHMNAYIRIRLAFTENNPIIKPYDEKKWAELSDAKTAPVEWSLQLIKAVHLRWVLLLENTASTDFKKTFHHPENGITMLDKYIALYAWHGKHHVAHITSFRERSGL